MNKYELAVVVNGKLEEDDKTAVLGKVKDLIERFGGKINFVDEWGKKRFAYEVHKRKEGYYTFIKFEAEATTPAEIEKRIRIMDNVERYLLVIDEHPEIPKKDQQPEEAPSGENEAQPESESNESENANAAEEQATDKVQADGAEEA